MSKKDNIYIKRARRKRLIKRLIIMFIILAVIGAYVVFKTEVFLINKVKCTGDTVVTGDYILKETESLYGDNIFTIDKDKIVSSLKENPYVKKVSIKRSLPTTLIFNVEEAKGLFYIKNNGVISKISSDLILLENIPEQDMEDQIEILGIDLNDIEIGSVISKDTRIKHILNELYDEQGIIKDNKEDFLIKSVDLSDLSNIKVTINNIVVQLGTDEDMREKMNKAILVYKSNLPTEYINVSFNGRPDFK